jgi:hypothetical protein
MAGPLLFVNSFEASNPPRCKRKGEKGKGSKKEKEKKSGKRGDEAPRLLQIIICSARLAGCTGVVGRSAADVEGGFLGRRGRDRGAGGNAG